LDALENITNKVESTVHPVRCVVESRKRLYMYRQRQDQSLIDYANQLQSLAKTNKDVDPSGGEILMKSTLHDILDKIYYKNTNEDPNSITSEQIRKYYSWTNDHVLGMILILNTYRSRYEQLITKLSNDYVKGINNYPTTFVEYFALLLNYIPRVNPVKPQRGIDNDDEHETGLTLAQRQAKPTLGTNGNLFPNIECKELVYFKWKRICPLQNTT